MAVTPNSIVTPQTPIAATAVATTANTTYTDTPTNTVAATTGQTAIDFGYTDAAPLILSSTESLWVAIAVSNTGIVFRAEGYAY